MGISIGHNWTCSTYDKPTSSNTPTPLPMPDPTHYYIKKCMKIGKFLLVKINYPDCTNYEGNKILMYYNKTVDDLYKQNSLDPHFSNNSEMISPIARFEPTKIGWSLAMTLAIALSEDA